MSENKEQVVRPMIWLAMAVVTMAITLLVFFPASWLALMLEKQTSGRLTLGDADGTLWRGSAFIGAAPSGSDPVTPLLPGRFSWRLSLMALVGKVDLVLENTAALAQPVKLLGTWRQWQVSPSAVMLPAERLAGLGAPLNTIRPSGRMRLSWQPLQVAWQSAKIDVSGSMLLEMTDMASALSPIKPLGAYTMAIDWRGQQAQLKLQTVRGPMLLSGGGNVTNGRLQFSGRAEAEKGQEERLANLLNLLGQRRKEGDKYFIALEFNQ